MAIKDLSGWPDEDVPDWLRQRRIERRAALAYDNLLLCGTCNLHFGIRKEVLEHCAEKGHTPLCIGKDDKWI